MVVMRRGLSIDNFAGGGGASLGLKIALGYEPDVAINHDADAIAMHEANHSGSLHLRECVWKIDPEEVVARVLKCSVKWLREQIRRGLYLVSYAWFSPDCKHFSRAKGATPVRKNIRGLAWVAVKWARLVRPRVIILENVREFQTWGPLIVKKIAGRIVVGKDGKPEMIPDPARKGNTFRRFVATLRNLGYEVEWREMNAADFGAPTHRRRLFLIARCDGEAIAWPEATHGKEPGLQPWRTAAECIDWSIPCPSIFTRKRPLKENTLKRIARGMKRFVIDAAEPFIVTCNHAGEGFRGQGVNEPMKTITGARDAHGVVVPYVVGVGGRMGQSAPAGVNQPNNTVTAKNDRSLVTPYLIRYNTEKGKETHASSLADPIGTIVADPRYAMIAPFLAPMYGKSGGATVGAPSPTASSQNHHMLAAPVLIPRYGERGTQQPRARSVEQPMPAVVPTANGGSLAAAYLVHMNHGAKQWSDVREPLRTVVSNNHAAEVRAFLIKYYGAGGGQSPNDPLHTVSTHDRFGLVMIHGEPYEIVDIGMRMLTPRELARAQGFPDSYILTGTKTNQVARIGNSVCPPIAAAVVRANPIRTAAFAPGRKAVSA